MYLMLKTKKNLSILQSKPDSKKITVLTAYDFNTARALEEAGIDTILVGDSLAMVALGYEDTTQVSFEEMLSFTAAVKRGANNSIIISDIPYCSAIKDTEDLIADAQKLIKAGASLVKIETAELKTIDSIKAMVDAGITVMGHIGYTPQSVDKFKDKSKVVRDEEMLISEAKSLEEAGVSSIVLEMVPASIAKKITETITIPTIGIGAGKDCDGQVLVTDDMLGRFNLINPKFLRRYSNQFEDSVNSIKEYIKDVKEEQFPSDLESFS